LRQALTARPASPIDSLGEWWAQQPLRMAAVVGAQMSRTAAQPLAQRHPVGLVLGAMAVGVVFAWSRPWRWLFKPAMLAGWVPQLLSRTLSQVPMSSWLTMLSSLSQPPARSAESATPSAQAQTAAGSKNA
jgi:hypothetical protein